MNIRHWISGRGPIDTPASVPHQTIEQRYADEIKKYDIEHGRDPSNGMLVHERQRWNAFVAITDAGLDIERLAWARWLAQHPRAVEL